MKFLVFIFALLIAFPVTSPAQSWTNNGDGTWEMKIPTLTVTDAEKKEWITSKKLLHFDLHWEHEPIWTSLEFVKGCLWGFKEDRKNRNGYFANPVQRWKNLARKQKREALAIPPEDTETIPDPPQQ